MIETLIDKRDNRDLIRDKIGEILLTESVHQVELATEAGKPNPEDWSLRVFLERSQPWAMFLHDDEEEPSDHRAIVNVSFDSASVAEGASNTSEKQKYSGTFNVDVYGYGVSQETAEGQITSDEAAVRAAEHAAMLVRNILMAATHHQLSMPGVVTLRMVTEITAFAPSISDIPVQGVAAQRLALRVTFPETAPQVVPVPLASVTTVMRRKGTGELYFSATVPTPPAP